MDLSTTINLILGIITTILGVMLKAEYDKRVNLQQQLSEQKRRAYSTYSESINTVIQSSKEGSSTKKIDLVAKKMAEQRQEIWQYGSDEVVKAYASWLQCLFSVNENERFSKAPLVLMADVIVKMRRDLGISKGKSLNTLDILRIFLTDVEKNYDEMVTSASEWKKHFNSLEHQIF